MNDIDGTIYDTTKIYSMAGAEEQRPTMNSDEIIEMVTSAGKQAVERNTTYQTIKEY